MRVALLLLMGCTSTARRAPAPVQPVIANSTHSCADAALGLENATRGVRSPDAEVFDSLRARCASETWPASAVDCFATMAEGDLGRCSQSMPDRMRESLFAVLAGGDSDRAGLAVARARLHRLSVGVAACDRFITTVSTVLTCEAMPIQTRIQLGNETADFWALPTNRLSTEDLHRMSSVCGESLAALEQQAIGVGCMP